MSQEEAAPALKLKTLRIALLLALTMISFAANSVLCRKALTQTAIDPATFTLVRMASGAIMLYALTRLKRPASKITGSWRAALALVAYAACFSFAYVSLAAGTGALLLFGAVQATMIIRGLIAGERLNAVQWGGLGLAFAGLAVLLAPGVTAPQPLGAALMLSAGIAWGAYSILGRSAPAQTGAAQSGPLGATAGNFLRATPLAALVFGIAALGLLPLGPHSQWDATGMLYAMASGALASGLGYALWYATLPQLSAAIAASIQLSVPVITAVGGAAMLGETVTLRLSLASLAVLGGIALVVRAKLRMIKS